MAHDPALASHARMRCECARVHRPPLILAGEPHPEIRILGPDRIAREEPRTHEVAPASEHRRDLDGRPRTHDLVERSGRARAAASQAAARAAACPEPAHPPWWRYGQTCV